MWILLHTTDLPLHQCTEWERTGRKEILHSKLLMQNIRGKVVVSSVWKVSMMFSEIKLSNLHNQSLSTLTVKASLYEMSSGKWFSNKNNLGSLKEEWYLMGKVIHLYHTKGQTSLHILSFSQIFLSKTSVAIFSWVGSFTSPICNSQCFNHMLEMLWRKITLVDAKLCKYILWKILLSGKLSSKTPESSYLCV